MISTSCWFRGSASGKASESFTMDPLLLTAELVLEHKGQTHRVEWTGGDFGIYSAAEGCMSSDDDEPREGQGGGFFRFATAAGHIFGEHLITKGHYSAMLMTGAMVTECARSDSLSALRPGERLRITL